jgi:hypothetical protein
MQTIHQYPLKLQPTQIIEMPRDAQPLSVQAQHERPYVWALIDTDNRNKLVPYKLFLYGTGHPADDAEGANFLGTFQLHVGGFVGHVFWNIGGDDGIREEPKSRR